MKPIPPLTVIEASAGTGKTFTLVTRLLTLIANNVKPERIVALTFSRLAAGEIFNSFIERLAQDASSEQAAAEESQRIGQPLNREYFIKMLRAVIAGQHLSLIGTLDSFLMRIVKMIPLEIGLEGEINIISDFRQPFETQRLIGEMLLRKSETSKDIFRQAFRLFHGNSGSNNFSKAFSESVMQWQTCFRDNPDSGMWGNTAAIWGEQLPENLDTTLSEIRQMAPELAAHRTEKEIASVRNNGEKWLRSVANFDGKWADGTPPKSLRTNGDVQLVEQMMRGFIFNRCIEETAGRFLLMSAYESMYAEQIRRRGFITFDDLPRLINGIENIHRIPLEYRLDAHFEHWALDEFQDTSRGQWEAMRNLIDEKSQNNNGGSVLIVGDRKQSIYSWRGGDVAILGEQVQLAKTTDNYQLGTLDESYRYVKTIADTVNRIFNENFIHSELNMDKTEDSVTWHFRDHVSYDQVNTGFVQIINDIKKASSQKKVSSQPAISDFFEQIASILKTIQPWNRKISTAILVRENEYGRKIYEYLKQEGVSQVVFEGDCQISDSPILIAFANLLKLAEHADDTYAYQHIACSPLAQAMYPDGLPNQAELSAKLLLDFTRLGIVRKFREVRESLRSIPNCWNRFTESRFADLIQCVIAFENMRDSTMRLSDFIPFLDTYNRRDFAEPGMVRIMTVHKSKGLGFDWVILPLVEKEPLEGNTKHVQFLTGKYQGDNNNQQWIISYPNSKSLLNANADDPLVIAEKHRKQSTVYDSLCQHYVAITRAKRALTLMLRPKPEKDDKNKNQVKNQVKYFSDLVEHSGVQTNGDPQWYLKLEASRKQQPAVSEHIVPQPPKRNPRQKLMRSRPSEMIFSGLTGDKLFELDFGAEARKGTEQHNRFAEIKWIDPEQPQNELEKWILANPEWRPAFVHNDAITSLWCERKYEIFRSGTWESGQFDRVVCFEKDNTRFAIIYDFKTNARQENETIHDFRQRMQHKYHSQLEAYRHAVSFLTQIPLKHIESKLLLVNG